MKINIYTQSREIPSRIGNIESPNAETLRAHGWRDMPDVPAVADGYTRVSITAIESDGVNGQWVCNDRLESELEAEQTAADLATNGTRYALQNQYLTLCDQLTGGTNHVKLGFAELEGIIKGLMATDPNTAVALSLQLLTLNAALVHEGGIDWWDRCEWKDLP